jgi:hypothetical protein
LTDDEFRQAILSYPEEWQALCDVVAGIIDEPELAALRAWRLTDIDTVTFGKMLEGISAKIEELKQQSV